MAVGAILASLAVSQGPRVLSKAVNAKVNVTKRINPRFKYAYMFRPVPWIPPLTSLAEAATEAVSKNMKADKAAGQRTRATAVIPDVLSAGHNVVRNHLDTYAEELQKPTETKRIFQDVADSFKGVAQEPKGGPAVSPERPLIVRFNEITGERKLLIPRGSESGR